MDFIEQRLPELGVVLAVPADWSIVEVAHADAAFLAPEHDGYRATVSLASDRLDPPTPERFEEVIGDVPAVLRKRHGAVREYRQRRFAQAGIPGWVMHYGWQARQFDQPFEQVMALLVVSLEEGRVIQLSGSMLASRSAEDLPVFQAILQSVRPLGKR